MQKIIIKKKSYIDNSYSSRMYFLNALSKFEQTCKKEEERKSQGELVVMQHTPV